jgi:hypothetical protein
MASVACNRLSALLVLLCVNGLHADYLVGVGELLGGAVCHAYVAPPQRWHCCWHCCQQCCCCCCCCMPHNCA